MLALLILNTIQPPLNRSNSVLQLEYCIHEESLNQCLKQTDQNHRILYFMNACSLDLERSTSTLYIGNPVMLQCLSEKSFTECLKQTDQKHRILYFIFEC